MEALKIVAWITVYFGLLGWWCAMMTSAKRRDRAARSLGDQAERLARAQRSQ